MGHQICPCSTTRTDSLRLIGNGCCVWQWVLAFALKGSYCFVFQNQKAITPCAWTDRRRSVSARNRQKAWANKSQGNTARSKRPYGMHASRKTKPRLVIIHLQVDEV